MLACGSVVLVVGCSGAAGGLRTAAQAQPHRSPPRGAPSLAGSGSRAPGSRSAATRPAAPRRPGSRKPPRRFPGPPSPSPSPGGGPPPGSATASWSGQLTGYAGPAWQRAWGYTPQSSWGQAQLTAVADPSAPGGGVALQVAYGKGSSANSCADCPEPGGGQFYTSFAGAGQPALAAASVLYLRYYVKFPAGFDFGRGGKLPGLYGGPPGQESGGHHGQAFSTRYMWRNHPVAGSLGNCSSSLPCAEVYLYTPQLSLGYGRDIGGTWNWQGDGRWHMIEQRVDRASGDITVWYDGAQVLSAAGVLGGAAGIPFSGVLFSTFFGGHDTSWGPSANENAYFADFAVSTSPIGP
jgi:hypothetical protein